MKNALGLNAKDFKHVKSDEKSTTLQHKNGHLLTIAHNSISPQNQAALKALAKATESANPKQSPPDNFDGGGEIVNPSATPAAEASQKGGPAHDSPIVTGDWSHIWKAKGGEVRTPASSASQVPALTAYANGGPTYKNPELLKEGMEKLKAKVPSQEQQAKNREFWNKADKELKGLPPRKMAEGGLATAPYDAGLPCLNPHCKSHGKPHPNCRCYSGGGASTGHEGFGFAEGGEVSKLRYCAHGMPHKADCEYAKGGETKGISEQGLDVRYGNSNPDPANKAMAQDMAREEARGRAQFERQHVKPKIKGLAHGGGPEDASANSDDWAPDAPMEAADHYREAARLAEKAGDSITPPRDPNFNSVTGKTEQPQDDSQDAQQAAPAPMLAAQPQAQTPAPQAAPGQAPAPAPQGNAPINDTTIPQNQMAPAPQVPGQPLHPDTQEALNESQAWKNDLNNGHITPKTYNDLMFYNKDGSEKSTLGKIGSIFGLMLGGAGAGLAHQPVMALQMMDNVIKNDLEAQKTSKENAKNYLQLNQQRLLNDANVQQTLASSNLTDAQKKEVLQNIKTKAYALSYMQMGNTAYQDQLNKMKNMQPGTPAYQQAAQVLMMMGNAVDHNNAATAASLGQGGPSALGMYGMTAPGQQNIDPEQKFQNDMQMLELTGQKDKADSLRGRHLPGVPGFASDTIQPEDKKKFTNRAILDDKVKDVINYAKQHVGSIDPKVLTLAAQKAHELTKFYNASTDNLGMTQGRLGWLDEQIKKNPTSIIQQLLGNQQRLGEIRDSNAHQRDIELNKLGFPVQPGAPGTGAPQQFTEGQTGKDKRTNKPVVFRNGHWIPQ